MKKRITIITAAALGLVACSQGGDGKDGVDFDGDTLTVEQRDSIMSELPIPGIGGVGAARRARDQANKRTEAHDTIR